MQRTLSNEAPTKHTGIILNHFLPQKQKVLIFDRELGPIEAVPDSVAMARRLCRGAFIQYDTRELRSMYFLSSIDILNVPFAWAREDILFLHHVLELSAFFIPQASAHEEIFDQIEALYRMPIERSTALFKKLFLVRFFILIGMYPEEASDRLSFFKELVREPIDVLADRHVHLELADEVDSWLFSCAHQHPQIDSLRTANYLRK
jgi:hypothetical protein